MAFFGVGRSGVGVVVVVFAVVMATLLATGCSSDGGNAGATPAPAVSTMPVIEAVLPSTLVGAWGLEGPGIPTNTVLTLAADGNAPPLSISRAGSVSRSGCFLYGGWRATTDGLFAGQTYGGSGVCREFAEGAELPSPKVLEQARSFGRVAGRLVLTAADGSVVATLGPGATPIPNTGAVPEYSSIPKLTDAARIRLDAPAKALPNTDPATASQIEGSWRPDPQRNPRSVLRFDGATGRWNNSDFCNGTGGPWALADSDGSFIAVGGVSSLIGCDDDDTPIVQRASYAGFDGDVLVFGDAQGKVLRRFVRAPASDSPSPTP